MKLNTHHQPVIGSDGDYPMWIQIPTIPGKQYGGTIRLLSVSKHSTLEITLDTNEKMFLVFPVSRYVEIIDTQDNRNQQIWEIKYNDKDLKGESELPKKNPDEDHR